MKYNYILLLVCLCLIFFLHYSIKNKYNKYIFPNFQIKEDIELPKIERKYYIPKVIYRTHKDEDSLKSYQEVLDKSKNILPDYKTKIFYNNDIDNYIKNNFSKRIYNAYNSINEEYGPAKADFFRYLVIYKKGGIYLDIKSGPIKNIDKIIDNLNGKMAISNWTNIPIKLIPILYYDELYWSDFVNNYYGEYQNWYIISGQGNPLLAEIIKQMVTNIEEGLKNKDIYSHGKTSVVALTGPLMLTKTIENHKDKNDYKICNPNLDNHLKYKIIDHIKVENNRHYKKNKNKYVI